MARNGAGTYVLPSGNPVVTGTTISSTWANNTLNDIGTALTQSVSSNGQTTPTANLPMGNYAHTGVADAVARTMYATAGQVQDSAFTYLTSPSGTNTMTATAALGMSSYVTGQRFFFVASGTNTGATTLNINSIGAKNITKNGTTALSAGDIQSGAVAQVVYDGTQFQLLNPYLNVNTLVTSWSGGSTGLRTYTTPTKAVTISFASPAVFTVASGDLPANTTQIELFTTGTLPTGLSTNTVYYVVNASGTTYNVSLTSGGAAINTTAAGSGTHTFGLLGTTGNLVLDGTLAVANGGTGTNTFLLNNLFLGNGTSGLKPVYAGATGNVLTSQTVSTVTAGSFAVGTQYTIATIGTTDFTLIGASANTVGVVFTATGVGTGTGTATTNIWASAALTNQVTGTGSAPYYAPRAWVNFNGTASGTFAGGASTVTRASGSTTCTVTTATAHGLTTGNQVYAASGVVAGIYIITVTSTTQFTFTTAATTALTAVAITFNFRSIRASGNVNSVAYNGTGDYAVNFTVPLPDADYAVNGIIDKNTAVGGGNPVWAGLYSNAAVPTANYCRVGSGLTGNSSLSDNAYLTLTFLR